MLLKLMFNKWEKIEKEQYNNAYQNFGGSLINHPDILDLITNLTNVKTEYYGYVENGNLIGAIASWGKYIAGDRFALEKKGIRKVIDFGCPDLILPLLKNKKFYIPFKSHFLSSQNTSQFKNSKINTSCEMSIFKHFGKNGISNKTKNQLKRKLKKFEEIGGNWHLINKFQPQEIFDFYVDLHQKRWSKPPATYPYLLQNLKNLHKYLYGYVLFIENKPSAIQINYAISNNHFLCVDYINGGLNTNLKHLSLGTLLFYLNLLYASNESNEKNITLRYSFGISNLPYKDRWCNRHNLIKT